MKNDPSGATAEGLPIADRARSITRRLFLGRAAALAPIAAAPALAVGSIPAAAEPIENPALLALLPEIEAAGRAYRTAAAEGARALKIGRELWPRAPRAIKEDSWTRGPDMERDISGAGAWDSFPVCTTTSIAATLDAIGSSKRGAGKVRRKLHSELEAARQYEEACEHARIVSGYPAATASLIAAEKALEAVVRRTALETARTMEGVRIKATALMHWNAVPAGCRVMEMLTTNAAGDLAASILDVLDAAA